MSRSSIVRDVGVGLVILCAGVGHILHAQTRASQWPMQVFFLETPKPNTATRLWVQITNATGRPQVLCRSGFDYSWIPDDPQQPAVAQGRASLHGCGDDDHDPFWLLLPGESRFDSYEVTDSADPAAVLSVTVEIMPHPIETPVATIATPFGTNPSEALTLEWKGRVADAVALGTKLKGQ